MLTLVDCNNFWSPSGGGVRRYHLEKMEYFKNQKNVKYHFVMHDDKTYTEQIGDYAFIEHLKVPKVMGNWEYRYLIRSKPMEPILTRVKPDIIEIGSPYFMPRIILNIIKKHHLKSKTFGFWHADFPITYIKRFLDPLSEKISQHGEQAAWRHARKYYNQMSGILASSNIVVERMKNNGLKNIHFLPLGVNSELFNPQQRDSQLIAKYRGDNPDRLIMFFPHRFSKEKGLDILIKAYPLMCKALDQEPALIIAGMGPYENLAREAANKYKHVHFHGFIQGKEEMAKFYASSDIGFALSSWETFGLSLLESLSCGLPLVAANDGASLEHIQQSGAGFILENRTPEGLTNAVVALADKRQKENLSSKARSYAEGLTWKNCFERQLEIYQSGINELPEPM